MKDWQGEQQQYSSSLLSTRQKTEMIYEKTKAMKRHQ